MSITVGYDEEDIAAAVRAVGMDIMSGITRIQYFGMAIIFFSVLAGGSAQLEILVGLAVAKMIIAFSTLVTAFLGGAQTIMGGQVAQIDAVMKALANNPLLANTASSQVGVVAAANAVIGSSAAGPQITREAKVAILDAAAPLTKNDLIVEKSLADATVNPSVRAG
jgi:hypothetical protein